MHKIDGPFETGASNASDRPGRPHANSAVQASECHDFPEIPAAKLASGAPACGQLRVEWSRDRGCV
jgi:hypothetical protein